MQIILIRWNLRRLLTLDLLAFSIYCVNTLSVETENRESECVLLLSTQTKQHHQPRPQRKAPGDEVATSRQKFDVLTFLATRPLLLKPKGKALFPFQVAIAWKSRATFLTNQEKSYLLKRSRALRLLQAFSSIFDLFNRLTSSVVIGWIKYFHFHFRKALWQNQMNRFSHFLQLQSRTE